MGQDFLHLSRTALGPTQPPVQWVPGLSRGKERPGRETDPSPPSSAVVRNSRAILLLPLWAVRPVQSLSACTRVHFTSFTFHASYRKQLAALNKQSIYKMDIASSFLSFSLISSLVIYFLSFLIPSFFSSSVLFLSICYLYP